MVSRVLNEKVQVLESATEELNLTAVKQVADILEEAEHTEKARNPEVKQWSYSMPFAGVRYYSY